MLPGRTRRSCATTRSPGCTSGCARTPRSTRTRWTSATAPGRSCSRCSGWSTTAPRRRLRRCPPATACCSTPTATRSWRAAPAPAAGRSTSGSSRRSCPTGPIYRALEKLLVLDGERLSYRALDVEQIGSVYETMMGFRLELATRPLARDQGAEAVRRADDRRPGGAARGRRRTSARKWLQDNADRKLTAKVAAAVKDAATLDDLHAALAPVIDTAATPDLVAGRRDGAAAERGAPPLRLALHAAVADRADRAHDARADARPPARRRRRPPTPEQILELKVCDPAMGSGAFLVEACRQLGDALSTPGPLTAVGRRSRPTRTR